MPSERWQARYCTPDGREHTGPQTFATKTDAARFLSHVEADIDRGVWLDHRLGHIPLRQWAERYMGTTAHLKPKTRESYASLLRSTILPTLGDSPVAQLRTIAVQEWISALSGRGLGASRVRQSYRLLSQIMAAAEDSGLIAASPCRRVRLPRMPESEPRILSHGQVADIISAAPEPYDLLIEILAYAGLRVGEAFALRRRSVDVLRGRLVVTESLSDVNGHLTFGAPKSHQQRAVSIPSSVVDRIRRHLDTTVGPGAEALLFVGGTGQPLRYSSFLRRVWRPALETAALIDVTPHDLRATHASWVIDEGGSVMDAAARLGHAAGTVTTRHYARPVDGRDAEIAARLNQPAPATKSYRARGGHVILEARRREAP
ncbi:MAG: tyrosine-type recombinase/integrase [Acidothermaceae bacterium]